MPSPVAHSLAGAAVYLAVNRRLPGFRSDWRWLLMFMVGGVMNDLDAVHFNGLRLGLSLEGHRGLTHSIFFCVVLALSAALIINRGDVRGYIRWAVALFLLWGSHLLLDALSFDRYAANGIGIPLLYPFSDRTYLAPWQIFHPFDPFHPFSWRSLSAYLRDALIMGPIVGLLFIFRYKRGDR